MIIDNKKCCAEKLHFFAQKNVGSIKIIFKENIFYIKLIMV